MSEGVEAPLLFPSVVIPAEAEMDCINHWIPACAGMTEVKITSASKETKTLSGDRVLRAFINTAEAMQIAVAAGLLAGRADGGLAVAVILREAR